MTAVLWTIITNSPKGLSLGQVARETGKLKYLSLPKIGLQCLEYVINILDKLKRLEALNIDVVSRPVPLHVPNKLENNRQPVLQLDTPSNQIHKGDAYSDTFSLENEENESSQIDTALQHRHLQVRAPTQSAVICE